VTDSINEDFANKIRLYAIDVIRSTSTFYRSQILVLLKDLQTRLGDRLASSAIEGDGSLTQFRKSRIQQLLEFANNTIKTYYGDISSTNTVHLTEIAELETIFIENLINKTIGVELITEIPSKAQLKAIVDHSLVSKLPSADWWKQQSTALQSKFKGIIREGLLNGRTNGELVRAVRGTRDNGFKDGIIQESTRNAEALVRSSVLTVQNNARLETLIANRDLFKGIMQISTLDSRTSPVCIAYSGKVWDMDLNPVGADGLPFNGGLPRHWTCRSTLVPIIKSFRDLGIDVDEVSPGTRASLDGQVPQDLSFDEWLKTKGEGFQNDLLGVGKAQLWRQNKINLTDLIDSTGKKVLTLEELKAKVKS
jgi:SPP1 gp7 family putative phage head morphogenesis protein